jgi:hypothetical protein
MNHHPAADIFPLLTGRAFAELVDSIRANGQREPIVMFEGCILDGRNRWQACEMVGIEPRTKEFRGDEEAARRFVVDANLVRRHLDEAQRAMCAEKLANMPHGGDRKSDTAIKTPAGALMTSQGEAAAMFNVSKRSVQRAAAVRRNGAPELVSAVEAGHVGLETAVRIAQEPHDEQRRVVAQSYATVRRRPRPSPAVEPVLALPPSASPRRAGRPIDRAKHNVVRELTEQGYTATDIAERTGLGKPFIYDARRRFTKPATLRVLVTWLDGDPAAFEQSLVRAVSVFLAEFPDADPMHLAKSLDRTAKEAARIVLAEIYNFKTPRAKRVGLERAVAASVASAAAPPN